MKTYSNFNVNTPVFNGLRLKNKSHARTLLEFLPQKSIPKITGIAPVAFAGTKCKYAIPLQNFWQIFKRKTLDKYINTKKLGLSTNKDGFADSFLKAGASTPISTSFVHDCSVMYLYNDKTKTHAMYHAAPYCKKDRLEFMLKKLMPEGFTRGAIIPGDYIFYRGHEHNMKNMFNVMKKNNPKAIVNVYYDSSRFPEIVGYKGGVYEIQNKKVKEQMDEGLLDALDYGQASFQILDLQGYNTFNDIEDLKERFSDIKIPKAIAKIFTDETNNFEKVAKLVKSASSIKELEELQAVFPGKETKILFNKKKEDLLIDELNKINSLPDLRTFYAKHRSKFIRMGRLLDLFQDKKKEIL